MRVANFMVLIPEGVERDSGHVEMAHGQVYTLRLGNHDHSRRCDAVVSVDGKEVGCFLLGQGVTITLERPPHDHGRFTFFRADSAEGGEAGSGGVAHQERGLIQVTFKPERRKPPVDTSWMYRTRGGPGGQSVKGIGAESYGGMHSLGGHEVKTSSSLGSSGRIDSGVTGLTGHSDQTFNEVANLDYDPLDQVIISIRLVAVDKPAVRPLEPAPRGNQVPPPVG